MSKFFQCSFLVLCALASASTFAKGERYGVTAGLFGAAEQSYEQGKSGTADILRFGLVHSRPIDENNNRWRWWFNLNYMQSAVTAPANGVYQEIQNIEFRVVPQFALADFGWMTPYAGVGASLGHTQYSSRWKVDSDGYKYGEQLEDKSNFEIGGVVSLGTVIKLGSNPDAHLQIIPQVSYVVPFNDGLGGYEASITLLF